VSRRRQRPCVEKSSSVKRPYYFIRVTVDRPDLDGNTKRLRKRLHLGFVDEITRKEARNRRAEKLKLVNAGLEPVVAPRWSNRELRRLRHAWPRTQDRNAWLEMIRAGFFRDGFSIHEIDMVEGVAKDILRQKNSPYYERKWGITLIAECSRIVELAALYAKRKISVRCAG
jgi:hypothetical protein